MKKLLRQLKSVNAKIAEINEHMKETEISNFYPTFGPEFMRDWAMNAHRSDLNEALTDKFAILEKLQTAIEAEKVEVSNAARETLLAKTA